jgi:hypothetical protein
LKSEECSPKARQCEHHHWRGPAAWWRVGRWPLSALPVGKLSNHVVAYTQALHPTLNCRAERTGAVCTTGGTLVRNWSDAAAMSLYPLMPPGRLLICFTKHCAAWSGARSLRLLCGDSSSPHAQPQDVSAGTDLHGNVMISKFLNPLGARLRHCCGVAGKPQAHCAQWLHSAACQEVP